MRSKLRTLLVGLSLMVAIALSVTWVYSDFVARSYEWERGTAVDMTPAEIATEKKSNLSGTYMAHVDQGRWMLTRGTIQIYTASQVDPQDRWDPDFERQYVVHPYRGWHREPAKADPALERGLWAAVGFAYLPFAGSSGPLSTYWNRTVMVPLWPAILLASLPTVFAVRRWARRRHLSPDARLCPACGYDLRASPSRCPECGALPVG